jgi:hypothetical protein
MVTDVTQSIVPKKLSFAVRTTIIHIHFGMVHIPSIAQHYLADFKQITQKPLTHSMHIRKKAQTRTTNRGMIK